MVLARPGSEDGSPAASQSAIGRKKLGRSVRGKMAARVKDTRQTARCRATSQNAIGEKDLAIELQGQCATMVIPGVKSEETFVPSQGAIGEIKMAGILRTTPCPESPTRGLRVAASDSRNRRASVKVRSVGKNSARLRGVSQR